MGIEDNPRPNHKLQRCCGNCKFFLSAKSLLKKGVCILPEGPKISKNPNRELKGRLKEFAPTHVYCYCDNHQWKAPGYIKSSIVYSGVDENEIG